MLRDWILSRRQPVWVAIVLAAVVLFVTEVLRGAEPAAKRVLPRVPSAEELEKAEKLVRDAFGSEIEATKGAEAKRQLAWKMWVAARKESPANEYAVLLAARGLAIEAGATKDALSMSLQIGMYADGSTPKESFDRGVRAWEKRKRTLADAADAMAHFRRAYWEGEGLLSSAARLKMKEIETTMLAASPPKAGTPKGQPSK